MYIVSVFFKAGLIYCTAFISLFNHNSKFSLFNNFELCCFNHSGNIIYLILGSLSEYSFFLIVSWSAAGIVAHNNIESFDVSNTPNPTKKWQQK